jgi:hypothetical protein
MDRPAPEGPGPLDQSDQQNDPSRSIWMGGRGGSAEDADSSEDEDDHRVVPSKPVDPAFTFYGFTHHIIPFHDILESFNTFKKSFFNFGSSKTDNQELESKASFDIREFQKTKELQSQKSSSHKISRFRPVEPKWDRTVVPDKELMNTLYRTPQADSSGKMIFTLTRDEAKDVTPWIPPESDRDLPITTLETCNPRLQKQILAHMNEVIAKVQREYDGMHCKSTQQSEYKAKMGADLNNLIKERDALVKYMKKAKKKANEYKPQGLFA